jgi:general secretion pathway protein L
MNRQAFLKVAKNGFTWWTEGLLAWLPHSVMQKVRSQPYVQCAIKGERAMLSLVSIKGEQHDELHFDLATENTDNVVVRTWLQNYQEYERVLLIPEQHCLVKSIQMPAQAKDNLDEMIKFEVDRQTPFSLDNVRVGYQLENDEIETSEQQLSVTLAVVPKLYINEIIDRLTAFSLPIKSILIERRGQQAVKIILSEVKQSSITSSRLNIWLSGLALLLMMMALYKPVIFYQEELDAIQPILAQIKKQALQVNELKQQNNVMIDRFQFLDTKVLDYRLRVDILNELAQLLPQHTWLELSEFKGNKLNLFGQSSAATVLISLLINTGHFEAVRFISPLTHDVKSGNDKFRIEAVMKPRQTEGEADGL